ncbi:hypothetical protein ACFQWF_14505 [Methylorubrum suomiense]
MAEWIDANEATELREPKTPFQHLVRRLAETAMSVTHHDASEHEPGFIHEVAQMERKFGPIIRGYMAAQARSRRQQEPATSRTLRKILKRAKWIGQLTTAEENCARAVYESREEAHEAFRALAAFRDVSSPSP